MKRSGGELSRKANFKAFSHLIALILGEDSVESLRVTKNVKEINFEMVRCEVESKKCFQKQYLAKFLRLTLHFM